MVKKANFPETSLLKPENFDYTDSYQTQFRDASNLTTSIDLAKAFFSTSPKWIDKLFALRNMIVSKFGLKVSDANINREQLLNNFRGKPGEQVGLFKIFEVNENEVILGEDDKHLNFRISLLQEREAGDEKILTISTTVKFHNLWGRIYFMPVKPFHKIIVPAMLKGMVKHLGRRV